MNPETLAAMTDMDLVFLRHQLKKEPEDDPQKQKEYMGRIDSELRVRAGRRRDDEKTVSG